MRIPLSAKFRTRAAAQPVSRRGAVHRVRLMLRNAWLLGVAGVLLLAGLIAVSLYVAARPTVLRFAVPSGGGDDLRLIQAIAQQFGRERATVRLRPIPTDGPVQSAAELDAGRADLAIVRADISLPKQGQAVAILRQNVVVLIVPAAGSIAKGPPVRGKRAAKPVEKIEDLAGRRIGLVGRSDYNNEVLKAVLGQYNVSVDKVTVAQLDPDNVATSLRKTPVDVIFVVGAVTSRYIADAIAAASTEKVKATFLPIGASEAIASRHTAYESTEIKEGVFGGAKPLPEETVETIAFNHYIVARSGVSDTKIADFTRLLFSVRQNLAKEFPAIAKIEKPDTDKDAAVQAHPGAAAYLDDDQKTFFDRYSDLLYWGLMLMSFLGSAAAWLASYAKADDRLRRMRVIEHLLDIVKSARTAPNLEAVDRLRDEVDDILIRTLHQVERNDLDEAALMGFSLAIDQAQMAVNDRRATLMAQPPDDATTKAAADDAGPVVVSGEVTQLRVAMKAAEQG